MENSTRRGSFRTIGADSAPVWNGELSRLFLLVQNDVMGFIVPAGDIEHFLQGSN